MALLKGFAPQLSLPTSALPTSADRE